MDRILAVSVSTLVLSNKHDVTNTIKLQIYKNLLQQVFYGAQYAAETSSYTPYSLSRHRLSYQMLIGLSGRPFPKPMIAYINYC